MTQEVLTMPTRPTIARAGLAGLHRPDPRGTQWSAVDLARRRSLGRARAELEASEQRGDVGEVVDAWRQVVGSLARQELGRLADPRQVEGGGVGGPLPPRDLDRISSSERFARNERGPLDSRQGDLGAGRAEGDDHAR